MSVNKTERARFRAVAEHHRHRDEYLYKASEVLALLDHIDALEGLVDGRRNENDLLNKYRTAFEILALYGVFKDAEMLKADIESGAFNDEYELIKDGAIASSLSDRRAIG